MYGVHGGVPEGAAGGKACVSYGALYGVITEGILRTGCVVDGALYGVHGGVPEGAAGGKACVVDGALYGVHGGVPEGAGAAGGKACVSYGALYGALYGAHGGDTPYTVRMTRSLHGVGL